MSRGVRQLAFASLLCAGLTGPAAAIGVDVEKLPDPAQEAQARALMKELRCLVCQNQSIEDSDADLARDLRHVVRERIAAGDSPEQVRDYLVQRYGDWVLLAPPLSAGTLLLWGTPALAVLGGAGLIWWRGRNRRTVPAAALSEDEARQLAALTARPGERGEGGAA